MTSVPVLDVSGLAVRLDRRWILRDLSLQVRHGERLGIVGPNGVGKSTLLAVLAGSLRPQRGRIRLEGKDITRTTSSTRARRGIARAFQGDALAPSLSVEAHLRLAGADPESEPTRKAFIDLLDTPVRDLDRDHRRRLAFALALARRPRVLLLDEPAAGLSLESRHAFVELLDSARQNGAACLWVEHDQAWLTAKADRVLRLTAGSLISSLGNLAEDASKPALNPSPKPGANSIAIHVPAWAAPTLRMGAGDVRRLPEARGALAAGLLGFTPSPPEIEIDGQRVSAQADQRRRSGVSGILDPVRLVDDLSFGDHLRLARVPSAAAVVFERLLPGGPRTVRAGLASGGERRLLAWALATCDRPRLLVLEEAWTGLSPEAIERARAWLEELISTGTAVLLAEAPPSSTASELSEPSATTRA